MAARKPKDEQIVIAPDAPDMVDTESLSALRETLGISDDAETTVHVYIVDSDAKIDSKIWDGDAEAFNLGALAKVYGSGQYRVKVYVRNVDGYKPCRYNRIQAWTLAPEDESKVQAAKLAARNPQLPTAGGGSNGDMRETVKEMMAGFQASIAQIMAAQKTAPVVDPIAQMTALAGLMKSIAPTPAAAGPDLGVLLGMLKTLKEITGSGEPSEASASERLMLKAADAFMPAIAAGLTKTEAAPQAQPVAALPAPAADQSVEEDDEVKVMERLKLAMFQQQLKAANKAAARGVAPGDYADSMYDNFEPDDLHKLATDSQWFALLCEVESGCKAHEAWYQAMRDTVLEYAVEDGVLMRDAAGNLTLAPDSDTVDASADPVKPADDINKAVSAASGAK